MGRARARYLPATAAALLHPPLPVALPTCFPPATFTLGMGVLMDYLILAAFFGAIFLGGYAYSGSEQELLEIVR